jgi:hypothetical protein
MCFSLNCIQGKYWLNKRHLFHDNKKRDGLSSQCKLEKIFPSLPCKNTICHVCGRRIAIPIAILFLKKIFHQLRKKEEGPFPIQERTLTSNITCVPVIYTIMFIGNLKYIILVIEQTILEVYSLTTFSSRKPY